MEALWVCAWALSGPPGTWPAGSSQAQFPAIPQGEAGPEAGWSWEGSGLQSCSGCWPRPRHPAPLSAQVLDEGGDSLEGPGFGTNSGPVPARSSGRLGGAGAGVRLSESQGVRGCVLVGGSRPWLTGCCLLCRLVATGPAGELGGQRPCRRPWRRTWQPCSGPGAGPGPGPAPRAPPAGETEARAPGGFRTCGPPRRRRRQGPGGLPGGSAVPAAGPVSAGAGQAGGSAAWPHLGPTAHTLSAAGAPRPTALDGQGPSSLSGAGLWALGPHIRQSTLHSAGLEQARAMPRGGRGSPCQGPQALLSTRRNAAVEACWHSRRL